MKRSPSSTDIGPGAKHARACGPAGAPSVFHGEEGCSKPACVRPAYYYALAGSALFCGYHIKKDMRGTLATNPGKGMLVAVARDARAAVAAREAAANRAAGLWGTVACQKQRMMQNPKYNERFTQFFPNRRATHRSDGGIPLNALSPMMLGPVCLHGGLVAAQIENSHQGTKIFPSHIDPSGVWVDVLDVHGRAVRRERAPTEAAVRAAMMAVQDPEPHRHNAAALVDAKAGQNKNIPVYSLRWRADGTVVYGDYLWSRQFYCRAYEDLATRTDEYRALRESVMRGENICIWGYDGRATSLDDLHTSAGRDAAARMFEARYLDASSPFGHEDVLATLLSTDEYPWRKYATEDIPQSPSRW